MKDVSQDYKDNEEADQRKPVELYHIWRDGGIDWYYTSGDIPVTFGGDIYQPAPINRGSVTYDATLDVTTLSITTEALLDPTIQYLAQNPIEILWISVSKLHRDDLTEGDNVFIGQVKDVSFKGIKGQVNCVGFEHFLKRTIPTWRYQLTCNHTVFDDKCSLEASEYLTSTAITLNTKQNILTSTDFGLKDDGYFIGGHIIFGVESRTIINHVGDDLTIMYRFIELDTLDTVSAYPGCDGRPETCLDKYNNIANQLAFPFIPIENPATRVTW